MSVRALISKHSFAPAEARGDSDNPLALQKDALAYADAEITIRVTISYYGFLYVKPGGQCGGSRPCQFHVFINGANKVVLNTRKKWTPWQARLIKEAGKTVPFQTKPVTSLTPDGSDSEEEDCDSDEIERLKQELAEQKEKYRNAKEKFEKKLKQELDEQKEKLKEKFEKKLNKELDEQKETLKERMRGPYEDLQGKLKKCMQQKSDQSDLALENEQLRQKIKKLLSVFHRLKDKVDATVKRM